MYKNDIKSEKDTDILMTLQNSLLLSFFQHSSLVPRSLRLSSRATSWRTWYCLLNSTASSSCCTNLLPPRAPCPARASTPTSSRTWRKLWPYASAPSTSPPPRAPWCDVVLSAALRSRHSIHVTPLLNALRYSPVHRSWPPLLTRGCWMFSCQGFPLILPAPLSVNVGICDKIRLVGGLNSVRIAPTDHFTPLQFKKKL